MELEEFIELSREMGLSDYTSDMIILYEMISKDLPRDLMPEIARGYIGSYNLGLSTGKNKGYSQGLSRGVIGMSPAVSNSR